MYVHPSAIYSLSPLRSLSPSWGVGQYGTSVSPWMVVILMSCCISRPKDSQFQRFRRPVYTSKCWPVSISWSAVSCSISIPVFGLGWYCGAPDWGGLEGSLYNIILLSQQYFLNQKSFVCDLYFNNFGSTIVQFTIVVYTCHHKILYGI